MRSRINGVLPILMLVLFTTSAFAQIRGPVTGYLFDQGSLRAVRGIPGAAVLDAAIDVQIAVDRAAVSPNQDYAFLISGDTLFILKFSDNSQPREVLQAPDRIALSSSGAAAALLYAESRVMRIVVGLPDRLQLLREFSINESVDLSQTMAVSDQGDAVLGTDFYGRDGEITPLMGIGKTTAAVFIKNRSDLIVADSVSNQIVRFTAPAHATSRITIAEERDGVLDPIGVGSSLDGRRVFAGMGSGTIISADLTTGQLTTILCDCRPSMMQQLRGNAVFRLTDVEYSGILILDGDAEEPRIVITPAPYQD
jgi:hypothetical protein